MRRLRQFIWWVLEPDRMRQAAESARWHNGRWVLTGLIAYNFQLRRNALDEAGWRLYMD